MLIRGTTFASVPRFLVAVVNMMIVTAVVMIMMTKEYLWKRRMLMIKFHVDIAVFNREDKK